VESYLFTEGQKIKKALAPAKIGFSLFLEIKPEEDTEESE
jgi:hypothetical protein